MKKYSIPRIRLGGTSFLLPADYVPATRFTAERCEDVALLLLETGNQYNYLITPAEIAEIAAILDGEGASAHIHLPADADFDTLAGARALVGKVRAAMERTARLLPHTFVLHVNFPSLAGRAYCPNDAKAPSDEQRAWTAEALRDMAACAAFPAQLAIENLETFPAGFWDGWLAGQPYSRCFDIGHVWKDGGDPGPLLADWLPRVRVIHLHGLLPSADWQPARMTNGVDMSLFARLLAQFGPLPRDHKALSQLPAECIDAVMHPLWERDFAGVLTLEVFSFADFTASHAALMHSWERYACRA